LQRTISTYIRSVIPAVGLISAAEKRNKTMLLSIIRYFNTWKRYGVAVDELSHLSDRELADIGITRSDIPRIAWEQSRHLA
jgi:uncharacterized protein YjiS (DUF1127 family)